MTCPRCGYILDPFDRRCPKCEKLARTGQAASLPGQEPAAPAPPWALQSPANNNHTAILLFSSIFLVLILITATIWALAPRTGKRGVNGLTLLQTGGPPSGFNLTDTPAVGSAQINQRLLDASAKIGGEIEVSLAWNSLTDLDIQVADPQGELITASHALSASGGKQDVDANPTPMTPEGSAIFARGINPGPGSVVELPEFLVDLSDKLGSRDFMRGIEGLSGPEGKAPSLYTRSPVEHIYFAHAPKGTYSVHVRCFWWREHNRNPLPFTIQVRSKGSVFHEVSGTIGPQNYIENNAKAVEVCRFELK